MIANGMRPEAQIISSPFNSREKSRLFLPDASLVSSHRGKTTQGRIQDSFKEGVQG
jgi:hypothetical protein